MYLTIKQSSLNYCFAKLSRLGLKKRCLNVPLFFISHDVIVGLLPLFAVKTGPSVSSAALGKMNLTVKAISEGGFESLYKQTFTTYPNEKLKKSFACYLSTSTGPVAGTLYLSNIHVAFCSDRPLCFTAPSGQETWTYYKVLILSQNTLSKLISFLQIKLNEG